MTGILVLLVLAAASAAAASWHAHLFLEGVQRLRRALPGPPEPVCLYPLVYGANRAPSRWQSARCVLLGHAWTRSGRDCRRCGRCRCLLFLEQANPTMAAQLRARLPPRP
jgi:hypothetical protein